MDTLLAAEALGGMAALRKKSLALTDLFISLVDERCQGQGINGLHAATLGWTCWPRCTAMRSQMRPEARPSP